MKLSLFFDVEDPYNPLSDDAALEVVRAFDRVGLRGCFCVTGEKCRVLLERGRHDVIAALRPHSLGLHTNTHSVHPTTMELLEHSGWDDGVTAAIKSEEKGVAYFEEAFGRKPSYWGGAGFTWAPQIAGALFSLGIPSYVYALTEVPGKHIHQFENCVAFPLAAVVPDTVYEKKFLVSTLVSLHIKRKIKSVSGPWAGVLLGHPSRLRYTTYFDAPFAAGTNPDPYPLQAPKSDKLYQLVLNNLALTLELLKKKYEIVGIDDVLAQPMQFRFPTAKELEFAKAATVSNIRKRAMQWPTHKSGLTTAKIESVTVERFDSLKLL